MEQCFRTNFHGPMNITRAFLPYLRARGTGTLFYVGSQAGWHGDPSASSYCASKFALEGKLHYKIQPQKFQLIVYRRRGMPRKGARDVCAAAPRPYC
jgi:NAD(P)-dependent dehydrogenase (short-subunit alcohol dehydrogenase family)